MAGMAAEVWCCMWAYSSHENGFLLLHIYWLRVWTSLTSIIQVFLNTGFCQYILCVILDSDIVDWTQTCTRTHVISQIQNPTQPVWQLEPKPKPEVTAKLNPKPNPNLWNFSVPKSAPICEGNWTQNRPKSVQVGSVLISDRINPNPPSSTLQPRHENKSWSAFHIVPSRARRVRGNPIRN